MNCINCGIDIPDESHYCLKCGALQNQLLVKPNDNGKVAEYLIYQILQKSLKDDYTNYFDKHYDYSDVNFAFHFEGLLKLMSGEENAVNECKEVLDILEMYNTIIKYYKSLEHKDKLTDEKVAFPGFDDLNETNHYYFAWLFLKTLNKYPIVEEFTQTDDLKTHCSILPKYRAMLRKWSEIKSCGINMGLLNESQIIEILDTI